MLDVALDKFVLELDSAVQSHLEWSRRVLRCAVLRASPGDDVLDDAAHELCNFGRWFVQQRANFDALDAERAGALAAEHQAMHDAIRRICSCVLAGQPGSAEDLGRFENTQRRLIELLAYFKTLAVGLGSQMDPLTGLPLRHRMEQDFDLLAKHIHRRGQVHLVMMVDIDHFKNVNDQYGHAAGDIVLQQLSAALRQTIRENDLIYRYGGEEFLLHLECSTDPKAVEQTAKRVLEAVRALNVVLPGGATVCPTVTIGVAMAGAYEAMKNVIKRADVALYEGKRAGRNRYVIAQGGTEA